MVFWHSQATHAGTANDIGLHERQTSQAGNAFACAGLCNIIASTNRHSEMSQFIHVAGAASMPAS
jgi:hypothetical protein